MAGIQIVQSGLVYYDSFVYQNAAGGFVTGKVQANFTMLLSFQGTGGQPLTGITITATSNPGEYEVFFPSTSIPAATGQYDLIIYDTANPQYSWNQEYLVSGNGLPGGFGAASFTSSIGQGRAVDGSGNPLANVSIYIKTAAGIFVALLTTNSAGNWGPFYAPAGTYTVTYQLSGYTTGTATLVFAGSTVTGPLTDIAMPIIVSSATITAASLWTYGRQQSYDQQGSAADTKIQRAVGNAIDMVAQTRLFSWWLRRDFLSIMGAQNFTITLTNGSAVVTATGVFPSWATLPARFNVNSQILDIISQTNTTTVVLKEPWNGVTASYAAVLILDTYALNQQCYQFGRILPGQSWGWGGDPVTPEQLWEWQNLAAFGQQGPSGFAKIAQNVILWPYPTQNQTNAYTYHARPVPVVNPTDIADIDPTQIGIIQAAIAYQIAREFGKAVSGDPPATLKLFHEALSTMVTTDQNADLPSVNRYPGAAGTNLPVWRTLRQP